VHFTWSESLGSGVVTLGEEFSVSGSSSASGFL